ncbi:MAG: hypothetical protein OXH09_10850 [Gammaproteobacteria bacterium]|nr:hypothetical protein [Gammaproteobacteria bacterium]
MKIKKHVLAWGLVAGLAGVSGGAAVCDQPVVDFQAQAGYYFAKKVAREQEVDEGAAQAFFQASGAAAGAAVGALIGAKVGSLGGPIGAAIGAGFGAL